MDCITGLGQVKFNIGSFYFIMIINGGARHVIAVELVKQSLTGLERILGRNDEPHFFQVSGFRHDVGNDEVADVYRVEGAEE